MHPPGAITDSLDVVQLALAAFAAFFVGLVIYLRREDKREGYPLLSSPQRRIPVVGWPVPPPPKTYRLLDGGVAAMPHHYSESFGPDALRDGMPLVSVADALQSNLGPGAHALRSEIPMRTLDGRALLMPLRDATDWSVHRGDFDPRGAAVLARNFRAVGRVSDLWVDRAAKILRYLEISLDDGSGTALVPIFHTDIDRYAADIRVLALKPEQFAQIPRLAAPDLMTPREEDRLNAYYAAGEFANDED